MLFIIFRKIIYGKFQKKTFMCSMATLFYKYIYEYIHQTKMWYQSLLIFVSIQLLQFMHFILLCSLLSFSIQSKRGMECNLKQVLQTVIVFSAAYQ